MGRALGITVAIAASMVLIAPQHAASQATPDPATDLVRTRAYLTTSASTLDLSIEGVTLANAVFSERSGPASVRTVIDHNTIHFTRNPEREAMDFQIDLILAGVRSRGTVTWTISAENASATRLDVRNMNRGESRVDAFDMDGTSGHFTTKTDLLRSGIPLAPVTPVDSRLVLAFFYPWWSLSGWTDSPLFLDTPARSYSTDDPDDLVRVMAQAKSAGLDALVVSWAGRDFAGGIDHRRMLGCLAAAGRAGIKIAALFEATVANPQHEDGLADPDTVFRWLVDVVDEYASHPEYLRVDGRPVVMAYAAQRMSQAGWASALARLRATGRDILMIGEGINNTRLGALDGQFFYASNNYQGDEIRDFDLVQGLSVRTYHLLPNGGKRRIWVATVSPGYDDRRLQDGRVNRVTDRENGAYYARQWQAAIDMRADWVVVTSWNEWLENTYIEPSARYGDQYVGLTKTWAAAFRRRRFP